MADHSDVASSNGTHPSVTAAAAAHPDDATLIAAYFAHVAREDQPRRAEDIASIVAAHKELGERRHPGEVLLRTYNPTSGSDGWGGSLTVLDIVNDDMPYLVESVIGELAAHDVTVHRVLHPIMAVRRDDDGRLTKMLGQAAPHSDRDGARAESWMHLLIDRLSDADRIAQIEARLHAALADTRTVVTDAGAMTSRAREIAAHVRSAISAGFEPAQRSDAAEAAHLLDWFTAGNAVFLGYRRVSSGDAADNATAGTAPSVTALGLLTAPTSNALKTTVPGTTGRRDDDVVHLQQLWPEIALRHGRPSLLVTVVVPSTSAGRTTHQFLVGLTPAGRSADATTVPILRGIVNHVLRSLGTAAQSYSGQQAIDAVETYPREELFWAPRDHVTDVIAGRLQLASRRRLRAFLQPDPAGRFVSVLVFLPRDRYTTARRETMQQVLLDELSGTAVRYTARVGDSLLASVHFTVWTDAGSADIDVEALTRGLRQAVRSWEDRLVAAVVGGEDDLDTAEVLSRYADAFDESYKEDYAVADAVADLERLDRLASPEDLEVAITRPPKGAAGDSRFKLYVAGSTITLSTALPMLHSMGITVVDERPYQVLRSDGTLSHIYDFGALVVPSQRTSGAALVDTKRRFSEAFLAVWQGEAEVDGFNSLVLAAQLQWRECAVLRAYARYLRQIGSAYTQGYIEQVLGSYPHLAAHLAALFAARFDPEATGDRAATCADIEQTIAHELDEVTSLDADRILRTYVELITGTDRTNVFQTGDDGQHHSTMSFKIAPHRLTGVPKPVPAHEIWVYSPRVEGVHLRFGAVSRGGLRWSDRPEDFRTEVLGLVKAQEVKNAVIVPVGAKGGFVVKRPPKPTGESAMDREAAQQEGVACYRAYISAMLDVTDNRVGGDVVPPRAVVRHDGDDSYLVVAADKGTARFSDLANSVARDYGYWLDDAFASGGSAGYDHKEMGITARGGWESVKHHFREQGIDTQTQEFTVAGIGDMSGDVFGNGMLQSRHIRLVAAFDHRHIFIDPAPDCTASFAERQRVFDLPRSSWADYDTSHISAGGGVWPRTAKSITLSDEAKKALGLSAGTPPISPDNLIRKILTAPVDLLWNGGIGTYVKSESESNSDVGDKANDHVRVNGGDLRATVVGEGGNLGVTQLGRIEFARAGGRINTDAIDNSAGVDSSDHEVNIKIGLQPLVAAGDLVETDRNALLKEMTSEVAQLVLGTNEAQNRLLGVSRHHAVSMLSVHQRQIRQLVDAGRLDRELEFLPSDKQIDQRIAAGEGLTSPELSVLIAYTKAKLTSEMLASDLPASDAYGSRLPAYFPSAMRERYSGAVAAHPLAREIVTTMAANEVVNRAGITYAFRLGEEIAASATDAIRAFTIVSDVFDLGRLADDINAADHVVPAATQDRLTLLLRRLLDRASRWMLSQRPQPLDVSAEIERYRYAVAALAPKVPDLLCGVERDNVRGDIAELVEAGATEDLAARVTYSLYTFSILDIADVADASGRDLTEVAGLYYALSAHMDFDHLLTLVSNLPRGDRWHALARQALRDDIYRSAWMLTADVLSTTRSGVSADEKIAQWEEQNASRLSRARTTLDEIAQVGASDLAALSVVAREVRTIIR